MFGFRISGGAVDPCFTPHSKWRPSNPAKIGSPSLFARAFRARGWALLLTSVLLTSGCNHTPTYSGPPNTVIKVVMKKWAIVPARIVVPQGARVELIVSTADVEHGLGVRGLGINEPVQPGKPAPIRFLAQIPGTYPMRCSILCGKGHKDMLGEIVIEPNPNVSSPSHQP
ncbi:MAG TPA: cupredoxin domain-containing protein [Acidobacteriaceae bacterium]|nr:cupredoxin domain-containing protein [Acidobacteriaceae bacterium]